MKQNLVGWFEIPVHNMERAIKFYEIVFNIKLKKVKMDDIEMAWFPSVEDAPGAQGSLVYHKKEYKPSSEGTLLYFTPPSGDLAIELKKAEEAGAKILMQKRLISEEIGYMGMFMDLEGNRIAMHSRK